MTPANELGSDSMPLQPGEADQSDRLEDAEHWLAVYEELIRFLMDVKEVSADKVASFRARLDYWRHRRDELAGQYG